MSIHVAEMTQFYNFGRKFEEEPRTNKKEEENIQCSKNPKGYMHCWHHEPRICCWCGESANGHGPYNGCDPGNSVGHNPRRFKNTGG
jgi:hypothetical protein